MDNPCREMQDLLAGRILGLLDEEQASVLKDHLSRCLKCRKYLQSLENENRLLVQFSKDLEATMAARRDRVIQALNRAGPTARTEALPMRRTIMKSKITKLTAAAVIFVGIVSIILLDKSIEPAYGLEQTIQACQGLRYIHVQNLSPPAHDPQDTWLEFDENGELIRMRVEEGKGDSFRIMVWADGTIKWWSPPKNEFVVLHETDGIQAEVRRARELVDPKYVVQSLYDLALDGKVDIEIEQPTSKDGLIKLTATDTTPVEELPPRAYRFTYVLLIDPQTKLAIQREHYLLKNGEYELRRCQLYLEYNEPIDPTMFELQPPQGVQLEDRTKGIGLPQGGMTDSEAAAEVVRQYIKALIARDYEKAGKLYNGKPADELRERVEERLKIKHLRFIAVGEPVPKPERGPRAFAVPFAFEIETSDGKREIVGPYGGLPSSPDTEANLDLKTHRQAMVRPVVDQPDRWVITGGI